MLLPLYRASRSTTTYTLHRHKGNPTHMESTPDRPDPFTVTHNYYGGLPLDVKVVRNEFRKDGVNVSAHEFDTIHVQVKASNSLIIDLTLFVPANHPVTGILFDRVIDNVNPDRIKLAEVKVVFVDLDATEVKVAGQLSEPAL